MKRLSILIFNFCLIGLITSCNKSDIEDLNNQVDTQNQTLNTIDEVIDTDDGIYGSVSGNRGIDSAAFQFDYQHTLISPGNYKVGIAGPTLSKGLTDNGDGTYTIWITRKKDIGGSSNSEIKIENYNPSIGISSADIYTFIYELAPANDIKSTLQFYQEGNYNCCGDQITVDHFSLDLNTREISVALTIESVESDGYNSTDNPTQVTMNFNGVLDWAQSN